MIEILMTQEEYNEQKKIWAEMGKEGCLEHLIEEEGMQPGLMTELKAVGMANGGQFGWCEDFSCLYYYLPHNHVEEE